MNRCSDIKCNISLVLCDLYLWWQYISIQCNWFERKIVVSRCALTSFPNHVRNLHIGVVFRTSVTDQLVTSINRYRMV